MRGRRSYLGGRAGAEAMWWAWPGECEGLNLERGRAGREKEPGPIGLQGGLLMYEETEAHRGEAACLGGAGNVTCVDLTPEGLLEGLFWL